jgi:hypothetical protein
MKEAAMPPFIELFVIVFSMMGGFFLMFVLMFLLALFLAPIERSLSRLIRNEPSQPAAPKKTSFKDFSRKHGV